MGRYVKPLLQLELCRVLARPPGAALQTLERGEKLAFRALSEHEVLAWCGDAELELRPDQVQAAFARGDICLGALDGDRLVGYAWLAFGPAPHTGGVWVHFHPQGRYSYKKLVRPGYRGRRVAHRLSALADAPVFTRGRQFTVSFVSFANRSSLKSTTRSGSRTVGYAGILRCGGRAFTFRSPGARRYGFRFAPSGEHRAGDRPAAHYPRRSWRAARP